MAGPSKKRRPSEVRLSRSEIVARQVRMARAALGMTLAEFGRLVGLSANTISHLEHAHVTLSRTLEGLDEALRRVAAIELLPDTGESIGIRLHYGRLNESLGHAIPVYAYKQGRGKRRHDPDEFKRGMIGSDYPLEKLMKEYADHEKRYGQDKRIGKRPNVGAKVPDATGTESTTRAEGFVNLKAAAGRRIADGENPIRVWREHRKVSLTALARKLRIAKGILSQIETGKRSAPITLQHKIARALGVKREEIAPPTRPENKPDAVPATSLPAEPMKASLTANVSTNEPSVAGPVPGADTQSSVEPGESTIHWPSPNMQHFEELARRQGVPLKDFLDAVGKHYEERHAELRRARKPR